MLAVAATDPALGFLSTVSGVTIETIHAAIDLVAAEGNRPALVVPTGLGEALLLRAGFVRAADRLLALKPLTTQPRVAVDIIEVTADDAFLDVLMAGYEVDGPVAAFIRAEHRLPMMRRFLAVARGKPIAAAALTIHGDVAVLGGASTLPAHRGHGAQSQLLRHRLHVATDAGCTLAVATARPGSVSAANLARAGFHIQHRATWKRN
ncbi:Acetyltransferase (GNAT) family protein [Actinokineospora diospyrosa]|uniref:Acetyltransferase (GNAT) family protein n=1 Tax=Actinokineospora diospyrosa TaxID=103728 RepID=A0ABT1IEL5_9PSEU|nr:Acetyltransferase (GNAT) family protein [Actinokineospora diospyrosa]